MAASLILLVIMALLLPVPIERLGGPASVNYNEGWNAYRQAQAASSQPLYGSAPALHVTNYPPVWFHLVGAAPALGLGFNLAGRLLSLISVVLLGLLAWGISRSLRLSGAASIFPALFFVTSLMLYSPDRIGMNDPQLFAMAFSVAGLLAYLRAADRTRWLLLSALCLTIGVFTKNNLLAFPLAVLIHLSLRRQFRAAAVWCAAGIALAGTFLALTLWWDGRYFLPHLLRPRALVPAAGLLALGVYCLKFAAPLAIAAIWACRQPLRSAGGLLVLAFVLTHLIAAGFAVGDGVARNIFFEALFVTSIAVAAAIHDRVRPPLVLAGWLLVALSAVFAQVPGALRHDAGVAPSLARRESDFGALADIIGRQNGPVLCEDLLMCFEAHQPLGFDAYYVHDQILAGKLGEAAILSMLQRQTFSMIEIGADEPGLPLTPMPRRRFSGAFMRTLLRMYRPDAVRSGYTLLVPRRMLPAWPGSSGRPGAAPGQRPYGNRDGQAPP